MSKQCMRIELTYSDGTREFAAGDDAAKIMEWWGSCEGMNYIHGARYTGPQLQAAESDLLQRALEALEACAAIIELWRQMGGLKMRMTDGCTVTCSPELQIHVDNARAVLREAGRK